MKILLISGKMGSGKSTLAEAVAKKWSETKGNQAILLNFADALYHMHNFCLGYLEQWGVEIPSKKDRKLLQLLGTEWARTVYGEDVWVNIVKTKIDKTSAPDRSLSQNQLYIVADCRFPNEITSFENAISVRLNCDRAVRKYRCTRWTDTDNHPSENALDDFYDFDFKLNTETMSADECVKIIFES